MDTEGPSRAAEPLLRLNRNEYFFEHATPVARLLAEGDPAHARRYTPAGVDEAFSDALAARLGLSGEARERLCLFHGAEDALLKIFLRRGGSLGGVVLPDFSWSHYGALSRGLGLQVETFPVVASAEGFEHDLDALGAHLAASPDPRLVILATPNNPTGHGLDAGDLEALFARHPRHAFVVDAVYDTFPSPLARLPERHANVIFIGSMSKFFGLPGLRLGYAVGDFPAAFRLALGFNPRSLQIAATALAETDYYARNWASMAASAHELVERFRSPALTVFPTRASFLLVRPPAEAIDLEALARASGALPKAFTHDDVRYLRFGLGPRDVCDRIAAFLGALAAGKASA